MVGLSPSTCELFGLGTVVGSSCPHPDDTPSSAGLIICDVKESRRFFIFIEEVAFSELSSERWAWPHRRSNRSNAESKSAKTCLGHQP